MSEASSVSSTPAKQYISLAQGEAPAGVKIGNCSGILPNKMQCWRAADFLVIATGPVIEATDTTPASQHVDQYQLCRRHAVMEQETDGAEALAAQRLANDQAQATTAEAKVAADKVAVKQASIPAKP